MPMARLPMRSSTTAGSSISVLCRERTAPGIVHRLDRDTSGLMLAAKDDDTQRALQDLIRLRTLDRRYITLVHGYVAMNEGRIDTGIARSTRDRQKMAVSDDPFARQAITTFRVLERFDAGRFDDGYTLLECHLYTGRTHQIRVHMRHINHPCVGDPLYGRGRQICREGGTVDSPGNSFIRGALRLRTR